ncbi:MAG: hypothetical protein K6E37_01680 [Bacteroidales bacterium]|nr:hypothetical protein [Bacteroidales bacterium]
MEHKPQLVIVPDEDFKYGLNHDAYPEYSEELRSGEVVVVSKEEATTQYGIASPKDNKIYVLNVFDGTFRDITAESTEKSFIEAKAVAIREALIMLGAYSAELVHRIEHVQDKDLKLGAKVKKGVGSIGVDYHQNKHKEINLDAKIQLKPFKRPTKSVKEVRQFAFTHGLGNESSIIAWIDRLERDGKLGGAEEIEITFLEELAVARDAALNLQLVKCEAGFNIESLNKETHSFFEKISIDFGE